MGKPKIRSPQNQNPWTDWDKIWHGWLRRLDDPSRKISCKSAQRGFLANRWNIRKNFCSYIPAVLISGQQSPDFYSSVFSQLQPQQPTFSHSYSAGHFSCQRTVFTRESSYCFQRVLAIAILSVRLSVRPSVCHTGGSVKKRCKLESPNLYRRLPEWL